jgi:hypothetical protein
VLLRPFDVYAAHKYGGLCKCASKSVPSADHVWIDFLALPEIDFKFRRRDNAILEKLAQVHHAFGLVQCTGHFFDAINAWFEGLESRPGMLTGYLEN